MSAVGKKVHIQSENQDFEGYLVSFRAESDLIVATTHSQDRPVAHYFGPTTYYFTVLVGATEVEITTDDSSIQIDLVKE